MRKYLFLLNKFIYLWALIGINGHKYIYIGISIMAEGGGFEPPKGIAPFNDLANRRLQPLSHPSADSLYV